MSANGAIRKVLRAMLVLAILLWAEAGLALIAGDRVIACHAMILHSQAVTMAATDQADTAAQDSDAMPCCPEGPAKAPAMSESHPPCCSVSNDAERPLAFLVSSVRVAPYPMDAGAQRIDGFALQPSQNHGQLRTADTPRFVKSILELKTYLRI